MIDLKTKKVLIIDLEKRKSETKSYPDLMKFIGGTGLGLKLLEIYNDKNPLIISVGPLNGFFPFTSKASVVLKSNGLAEDLYIGGTLSTRLKFTGLDSIVMCGKAKEKTILNMQNTDVDFKEESVDIQSLGLPGKRCLISYDAKKILADEYFTTPENYLEKSFEEKNIKGISITGTETYSPENFEDYKKLYASILEKKDGMRVEEGTYPSCSNCPMACGKSKVGEIGGNILINSLVSCQFADKIYTDIGMVFSCLNTLGYEYTHEDIENLPVLIEETIRNISK